MLDLRNSQQIFTPEAVIFDTDNTLYSYDPAHKVAIKSVVKKAVDTFGVSESEFLQAFEYSRFEIKKRLSGTASSHSRLLYFQGAIEALGMGTRILSTLDFEQTYWRTFLANSTLFPGVIEFIQKLKNKGIKIANITDLTAQIQFRKIIYFGLDGYFDYVITSEEAGCDKPATIPFQIALNKLNVPAEKIWMIGDDIESDITGASNMNMLSICKTHKYNILNSEEKIPANIVFDSYKELILLLG